ncbi:NADP-dependent phosphogluconate dehydrogenase, partial [Burkholderia pseudomallei]
PAPLEADRAALVESVRRPLYLTNENSNAQGFAQLDTATKEYGWNLDLGTNAKNFRAGSNIRARFLQKITHAYAKNAA